MLNQLNQWEYKTSAGFTVRGFHTEVTGKPVIHFVHGNGYCGLVYEEMLRPLTEHYDIFISDIQGHGDSDIGGHFRGWNRNAELCAEVWQHYRQTLWSDVQSVAMGHSFGGVISTLMMVNNPSLFDQGVLLDPVFLNKTLMRFVVLSEPFGLLKFSSLARRAKSRRSEWDNKQQAFDYFHQRGMFKGWEDACLWSYINHALKETSNGLKLKCPPRRESAIFASFPKRLWSSLDRLATPTQLYYGERSYPFVLKSADVLHDTNKFVTSEAVPGRHCFMQEQPKQTADRILAFLSKSLD
ncbi:alpha/beta fold hydrolase [Alkalimarinus coralli]|uniref:alpha/beta fold hydrolase n=1 Tax=Alkalimarinus coralli TaxID=2935863 RepID=UPI00202AE04B|nr:alpha/beta hydrolase [Alkalimarinus coralli]